MRFLTSFGMTKVCCYWVVARERPPFVGRSLAPSYTSQKPCHSEFPPFGGKRKK
ncbi:MAG: hypothetical protein V1904_12530 [Bacteroidota bacterium]